jgi:L-alanine-DL-glutamate epimerase-like enolase superfamily enzyme
MNRRNFLRASAAVCATHALPSRAANPARIALRERYAAIDDAAARPVLNVSMITTPVVIASIDFLKNGDTYLVRVRAKDGAEGLAVSNERDIGYLYPIAQRLMIPALIGRDARDWEALIEEIYLRGSNYKRQGLLLWLPFASLEFAVLDLLGQVAQKSVTSLLGGVPGKPVEVYHAHDDRTRSAEESVERMIQKRERYQTRAAKFKVGARMRRDADSLPGRSEAIIRLAREKFEPDFTLYADSNGSYGVALGTAIGRLCEEHRIAIYEEPVPHDQYEETKAVADALTVAVAGGEQESSHNRFRWMIAHHALDVVQPDLFYFGGFVRSIRVARMAHAVGLECSPHISGTGLGMLYMLHYVASIPNAGPFQEYKGFADEFPVEAPLQTLHARDGKLISPDGPGLGARFDPAWLARSVAL